MNYYRLAVLFVAFLFLNFNCKKIKDKNIEQTHVQSINNENLTEIVEQTFKILVFGRDETLKQNWMAGILNHAIVDIDLELKQFVETFQTLDENNISHLDQFKNFAQQRSAFISGDVVKWVNIFFNSLKVPICSQLKEDSSFHASNCNEVNKNTSNLRNAAGTILSLGADRLVAGLGNFLIKFGAQEQVDRAIAALNISESPAPSSGYDFNQNAAGVLRLMLQDIVSMLEESGIPPKILGTIVTYDETDRVETLNLKEAVAYYSDLNPLGDKEKKTQALKFIGLLVVHIEKQVKFSIDLIKKEFDYIYKECIESEESCKTVLKLVKGHISDYCDPNKISQYDSIIAQIADKAPNNSADWSPYFFSNSEWNGNGLKSAIATREIGGFEVNKINGDIIIESGSTYKLAKVKKELVGGFGFSKYQCNEYLKSQDPAAAEQNKLVFDLFEFNFKSIEEGRSRIDGTKNPCEVDGYSVDYVGPNKSSIISIYDESRGCKFARLKIACKMKSSTNVFPPNFNYKLEILGVYKPEGNDFEPLITSEEIKIEAAITTDSNEIVSCVDPLPDAPQPQ